MDFKLLIIFGVAVVSSWMVTAVIRSVLRILDVPNVRSSHNFPMPTLGGIGVIVGTGVALLFGCWRLNLASPPFLNTLIGSTLILGILSYDEIRPLGRVAKLIIQGAASLVLVESGIELDRLSFPGLGEIELGRMSVPATFLWLVSIQNLYDFMDGIDGLAGIEGFLVASLIGGLAVFFSPVLAPLCVVLAGAVLGFLFLNFPPAKVFMGDVGGHFLGLMFGVIAIIGETEGLPFLVIVLFLGAFLFDSIYTIFRRFLLGENITQAHLTHLYQRLNRLGWSVIRVDFCFGVCTILLGVTGYLAVFGYGTLAMIMGGVIGVTLVGGTVWTETKWNNCTKKKESLE